MKKVLFGLIACTALLGACQHERPTIESDTDQMSFSAQFEDPTLPQGAASRVARNNAFLANDKIGIFVVPYAAMSPTEVRGTLYGSGNYADNVPFTTSNGTVFTPVTGNTIAYPNSITKVDVYAFGLYDTVYQDLGSDPKAFVWTVDAVQTTDSKILRNDLMSAAALGAQPSTTPIALNFKHRLAKVDVSITVPAQFRGQAVKKNSLFIDGTRLKATVDMTNPTQSVVVANNNTTNPVVAIESYNTTALQSGACTFQAIVLPSTLAAGVTLARLELTLADNTVATLLCQAPSTIQYETGKQTQLTFTIENENILTLGTISISAWTTNSTHTVEARRPARLLFGTAGDAVKAKAVVTADLSLDDTTYTKVNVVYDVANRLVCTYLQPTTRNHGYLKSAIFYQANGMVVSATSFNPTFSTGAPLWIPGNPGNTSPGYNKITSTVTF